MITVLAEAPADPRPVLHGWSGPCPWPRAHNSSFASWSSHACSPGQRTDEELDLIFEELLHIKAVAHLSNSVSPQTPPPPTHTLPLSPEASSSCDCSEESPAAGPQGTSLPFQLWLGHFHLISCPQPTCLKILLSLLALYLPLNPRPFDLATSLPLSTHVFGPYLLTLNLALCPWI